MTAQSDSTMRILYSIARFQNPKARSRALAKRKNANLAKKEVSIRSRALKPNAKK